jgi:hypothetical protein
MEQASARLWQVCHGLAAVNVIEITGCGIRARGYAHDPPQPLRQLGDVGGDAPRLVAGEQLDYGKGPGSRRQK